MKTHCLRLKPNQDLRKELERFTKEKEINAGVVLTCVGSLRKAHLRLADENVSKIFENKFEIVSLVGTLSKDGVHLHISLSDEQGKTIGGHLKQDNLICTTAEIVIADIDNSVFSRKLDKDTGFEELEISKN